MSSNKQITSTVTDAGKLEIAITESERGEDVDPFKIASSEELVKSSTKKN